MLRRHNSVALASIDHRHHHHARSLCLPSFRSDTPSVRSEDGAVIRNVNLPVVESLVPGVRLRQSRACWETLIARLRKTPPLRQGKGYHRSDDDDVIHKALWRNAIDHRVLSGKKFRILCLFSGSSQGFHLNSMLYVFLTLTCRIHAAFFHWNMYQ